MSSGECLGCGTAYGTLPPDRSAAVGTTPAGAPRGAPGNMPLPRHRVLLVGTGAFGVTTLPSWALLLRVWYGWSVRACLTHSATRLVAPAAVAAATRAAVAGPGWDAPGVPHQELAEWPDLVIVAPATATFVAKAALGMPDSLALATVLGTDAPTIIAPSIAEHALRRHAVQRNLAALSDEGFAVVGPRPGISVHSGQITPGGMADIGLTLRAAWHVLHCGGRTGQPAATARHRDAHAVTADYAASGDGSPFDGHREPVTVSPSAMATT